MQLVQRIVWETIHEEGEGGMAAVDLLLLLERNYGISHKQTLNNLKALLTKKAVVMYD